MSHPRFNRPGFNTPREMLRTPVFYLMYLMFVLMAAGGLMATAQLAVIAKDFGVAESLVSVLGLTLPALTFALSMDRILNGLTRPFFGWVSDQIGRENTMFIAFVLEGAAILLLSAYGQDPVLFVVLSALVFFAWGEIYASSQRPTPTPMARNMRRRCRTALYRQGNRGITCAAFQRFERGR
jgi:MFS transporter, OFA family, oxalate/formate antiporter